jgi:hypothetical protein
MLVALGASSVTSPAQVMQPAGILVGGPIQIDPPTSAPASQPTTSPTSQPASAPAVARDKIMPILKQLDSDDYKGRQEAQKKLQALGEGALSPLREILKTEKLSVEVDTRIKSAMWNIKATTRPALLNPPERPIDVRPMRGMRADPPPERTEKPED